MVITLAIGFIQMVRIFIAVTKVIVVEQEKQTEASAHWVGAFFNRPLSKFALVAKKGNLSDRMEFRKRSNIRVHRQDGH